MHSGWRRQDRGTRRLFDHGIEFKTPNRGPTGKNASDISLAVAAMDLLHDPRLDAFCIASSDSDFAPLAEHLQCYGRFVAGIGMTQTPEVFRRGVR